MFVSQIQLLDFIWWFDFSNVVLGENVVNENPDCTSKGCLPSVQDIEVESVTVHEDWDETKIDAGNDIALVRLAKPARFYFVRWLIEIFLKAFSFFTNGRSWETGFTQFTPLS